MVLLLLALGLVSSNPAACCCRCRCWCCLPLNNACGALFTLALANCTPQWGESLVYRARLPAAGRLALEVRGGKAGQEG